MFNTIHYTLTTTSMTNNLINAVVTYEVYFDATQGIAYEVDLKIPVMVGTNPELQTAWRAKIVNDLSQRRLEYDILKRFYYQTRQTILVESALYNLQADLIKFLRSTRLMPVPELTAGEVRYPGYMLHTLTIWFDPTNFLPVRRVNLDRGNMIIDDFTYHQINGQIPAEVFELPKPAEAIADFDLYPSPPYLPRFQNVTEEPQYGVYVNTLIDAIKYFSILNQWDFGPFSTLKIPWLVEMPVTIYRGRSRERVPPLVAVVDAPDIGRIYFFVTYDFLGYVVVGFQQTPYDLSAYEQLPITTTMTLVDLVPLFAQPSFEKQFVIGNFVQSVRSNDFIINVFDMGGKYFDMVINNFSYFDNEGYLLLNIYGKEYWDSANMEAMFQYVVTGQLADAHTTPIIIYALNAWKRLGIYENVLMPVFEQVGGEEFARVRG